MLANLIKVHYQNIHEQTPSRQAHANPRHAVRGFVHALDQPRRGRIDQHGFKAAS